jgi:hypothetical protein
MIARLSATSCWAAYPKMLAGERFARTAERSAKAKALSLFPNWRGWIILGISTTRGVLSVLRKQTGGERSVHGFLDSLVRSTKIVMTRVEFGGTLFLVAVIGVLLTSREEGDKSSWAACGLILTRVRGKKEEFHEVHGSKQLLYAPPGT